MIRLVSVKTVQRQLIVTMQNGDDENARFTASVDANTVGGKFIDDPGNARTLTERVLNAINVQFAKDDPMNYGPPADDGGELAVAYPVGRLEEPAPKTKRGGKS